MFLSVKRHEASQRKGALWVRLCALWYNQRGPRGKNPARYARMGETRRAHRNIHNPDPPCLALPVAAWSLNPRVNPLPPPGNVVGAVHGRRGTRGAARGAPGAAW